MGLFSKIADALAPCVHNWATLTVMQDHETLPSMFKIVQACDFCAKTRTIVETINVVRPPTPHVHKWTDVAVTTLVGDWMETQDPLKKRRSIKGYKHAQRCDCGDMRTLVVGLAPKHAAEYGFGPEDLAPIYMDDQLMRPLARPKRTKKGAAK